VIYVIVRAVTKRALVVDTIFVVRICIVVTGRVRGRIVLSFIVRIVNIRSFPFIASVIFHVLSIVFIILVVVVVFLSGEDQQGSVPGEDGVQTERRATSMNKLELLH
jgi:hypothetical protein